MVIPKTNLHNLKTSISIKFKVYLLQDVGRVVRDSAARESIVNMMMVMLMMRLALAI